MQLQIGAISAVTALVAVVLFSLGVVHFRRCPASPLAQLCAALTMWAGVLGICAVLCLAGTIMIPPV